MAPKTYTTLLALPVAALLVAGCNNSGDSSADSGLYGQTDELENEKARVAETEGSAMEKAEGQLADLEAEAEQIERANTNDPRDREDVGVGELSVTTEAAGPRGAAPAGTTVGGTTTPEAPDADVKLETPDGAKDAEAVMDGVEGDAEVILDKDGMGEAADDAADAMTETPTTPAAPAAPAAPAVEKDDMGTSAASTTQPATRPAYDFDK